MPQPPRSPARTPMASTDSENGKCSMTFGEDSRPHYLSIIRPKGCDRTECSHIVQIVHSIEFLATVNITSMLDG